MTDTDLIIDNINAKIETVNKTIATSGIVTADSIDRLAKILQDHNGRLGKVEAELEKRRNIYECGYWAKNHILLLLLALIGLILILTPIAQLLGVVGVIDLLK